ncbi:hypothetical protein NDU88_001197 [Pleurodeles waltl]|uniref:Uncharacterized protein n=1 Tax=Pleurodeles waltl TaxID=8319 RepID=A0AAV7MJ19_PLEWA|nr:hypothetical protein NDU88_001197 [Pleurodeles waltl]
MSAMLVPHGGSVGRAPPETPGTNPDLLLPALSWPTYSNVSMTCVVGSTGLARWNLDLASMNPPCGPNTCALLQPQT